MASRSTAAADVIFTGGPILTMVDAAPRAGALGVADGRIVFVGGRDAIEEWTGPDTEVRDLAGAALLPGFVDPHSHFINSLSMGEQVNVSAPPVGPCRSPEEIVAELQLAAAARGGLHPGEMLIGYGYDENLMPSGHPLTRDDLDAAFPDNPVVVGHVSLHGGVLNSPAFAAAGITAATPTPEGGVIVRRAGSDEPLGLVMETAFLPVMHVMAVPVSPEQELARLRAGQAMYAAAGITTAQEGATHAADLAVLQRGAAAGALYLDVIAYPFVLDMDEVLAANPPKTFGVYQNRLKLGGIKITMDGSPQGRTAYFSTPYLTGGPGGETDWRGEPMFPQEFLNQTLTTCYEQGLQVFVHANGDAAIDMLLEGHAHATGGDFATDRRTTVIHSQFVRPDQLRRYVDYGIVPSLYTEHTFFFGDAHVTNRGPEQTAYISPLRDAIDLGLQPTNHTDFNVAPLDQMLVVWTAVNRPTRAGGVLGPDQRVTAYEALKAITINSARQHFEEDAKGSLVPGKHADLVILDADPTAVDPSAIKDIRVLETIKEGGVIYRRPA